MDPREPGRYMLRVGERQLGSRVRTGHVRIRVQYSTVGAIAIGDGILHLVFGEEEATAVRLVALSDRQGNNIETPVAWTCEVPEEVSAHQSAAFFKGFIDVILADVLVGLTRPGSTLLVHEASPVLYKAIWSLALAKQVAPCFTTSNPASKTQNHIFLHPRTRARQIRELIPHNVSVATSFAADSLFDGIFNQVVKQLPNAAIVKSTEKLYHSSPQLPYNTARRLKDLLHKYCATAIRLCDNHQHIDVVPLSSVSSYVIRPSQVINWTANVRVLAEVKPVTSLVTLSGDKTYLLAGMTGDLGQSLCRWMVSKGARHIVLASRNPNIDPKWIEAMDELGAKVISMSMDLSNRESVIAVYRTIQQRHLPPVGGVVNGALFLEDHLFEDQALPIINATFAPKVHGSLLLDELSGPTTNLDFFILFGSITGVVGNFKQTAYSAATGFQSALIKGRRTRGLAGSIVHPGLISGVGYITRKGSRWVEHVRNTTGSLLLSEHDLDKLFAEAILAGRPESKRNPEIVIGIPLIDPEHNPEIFWYPNPMTWDYIDYTNKASGSGGGANVSGNSVKAFLADVTSIDDVAGIVAAALVAKVRSKLNLSEDVAVTNDTSIRDLGIDSLVAVDLRTWFARELGVDIPLLQIMGGLTVEDLTAAAVPKLPASIIPNVYLRQDQEVVKGNGKMDQALN